MKRPLGDGAGTPGGHHARAQWIGRSHRGDRSRPTGQQIVARWINTNKAQSPPGNGNLFGLALTLDGKGFYFVNDDVNQLALSQ